MSRGQGCSDPRLSISSQTSYLIRILIICFLVTRRIFFSGELASHFYSSCVYVKVDTSKLRKHKVFRM